jgi:DNA-binding NarL/FixJ family response regulator
MTLRVVLAEDNLIAREGVTRVLERSEDIELVATCADAATLRATIDETHPDVVLTDIRMPPSETDEGIASPKSCGPRIRTSASSCSATMQSRRMRWRSSKPALTEGHTSSRIT